MPTTPRLRLDRIAHRRIAEVRKKEASAAPVKDECIRDESQRQIQKRIHSLEEEKRVFGTNLVTLFNEELVDFVRKVDDTTYEAVEWPSQATHQLVPTSWNKEDKHPNAPKLALSVCAVPLRRRVRQTAVVVRKPFPKGAPAYVPSKSVTARRNILRFLVVAMKAKVAPTVLDKMNSTELNLFYQALIRASRNLKNK